MRERETGPVDRVRMNGLSRSRNGIAQCVSLSGPVLRRIVVAGIIARIGLDAHRTVDRVIAVGKRGVHQGRTTHHAHAPDVRAEVEPVAAPGAQDIEIEADADLAVPWQTVQRQAYDLAAELSEKPPYPDRRGR